MNLKDSLKTLENIINKFEFLIEHQVYYLDEHEFELKNQVFAAQEKHHIITILFFGIDLFLKKNEKKIFFLLYSYFSVVLIRLRK